MMPASKNIISRLKAVSCFYGKSHNQRHISFLEGLPVELLQSIASYLPLSAAASFALSNKFICYAVGGQYWHHLRSQPLEYKIFLDLLEKDMTGHWLCDQCLTFHIKPKFHSILIYYLTKPAWKCTQPYPRITGPMSTQYTFPPIEISHLMVRMAMNRHHFGSEHGEPLDIFSKLSHKDSSQDCWWKIFAEAAIVANEFYVRFQYRVAIPSSKDFGCIELYAICPHIHSLDSKNPMAPIIKCLLNHRNTASCEKCKGLRQCRFCTTEFEVQISQCRATGHVLEITSWKNFGAGRSPDDPKWAQHVRSPRIPCLHAAKFSPGSIKSAFESEKHKNMQNSIRSVERNKPLSRFKDLVDCGAVLVQYICHTKW